MKNVLLMLQKFQLMDIKLDPICVDNRDVKMLEDLIVVAFNEACKKVDKDKEAKLGKYGSSLSGLM